MNAILSVNPYSQFETITEEMRYMCSVKSQN